jgi:hypothetical protein
MIWLTRSREAPTRLARSLWVRRRRIWHFWKVHDYVREGRMWLEGALRMDDAGGMGLTSPRMRLSAHTARYARRHSTGSVAWHGGRATTPGTRML